MLENLSHIEPKREGNFPFLNSGAHLTGEYRFRLRVANGERIAQTEELL